MKNLIYQTNIPKGKQPNHVKISQRGFITYAHVHDVEYMFNGETQLEDTGLKYPEYYERYRLFLDPYFDQYDKILYVDSDVYPYGMVDNIFKIDGDILCMPERVEPSGNFYPKFSVRNSSAWKEIHQCFDAHNVEITYFDDGQIRWYNTGVLMLSKNARKELRKKFDSFSAFNPPEKSTRQLIFLDEMWWILNLTKHKLIDRVTELDNKWNWTGANSIRGNLLLGDFPNANFLHFSGGARKKVMTML
jgi:lipopolysaccharide biosynthesis glycosyltransferase